MNLMRDAKRSTNRDFKITLKLGEDAAAASDAPAASAAAPQQPSYGGARMLQFATASVANSMRTSASVSSSEEGYEEEDEREEVTL